MSRIIIYGSCSKQQFFKPKVIHNYVYIFFYVLRYFIYLDFWHMVAKISTEWIN